MIRDLFTKNLQNIPNNRNIELQIALISCVIRKSRIYLVDVRTRYINGERKRH